MAASALKLKPTRTQLVLALVVLSLVSTFLREPTIRSANSTITYSGGTINSNHLLLLDLREILYDDPGRLEEFERLFKVHLAQFPVLEIGRWEKLPNEKPKLSEPHRQCLWKIERQGRCKFEMKGSPGLQNSPEMRESYDPWVWKTFSPDHQVLNIHLEENARLLDQALQGRKVHFFGDSLTRQWVAAINCELLHILNFTQTRVDSAISFHRYFGSYPSRELLERDLVGKLSPNDYVVFNIGHHVDPGNGKFKNATGNATWLFTYERVVPRMIRDFKNLTHHILNPSHVLFRTTSVRHFHSGQGDWYTNSSRAGETAPHNNASWHDYGGMHLAQPTQNLVAMKLVAKHSKFGILDTSPPTLARGDATSDGAHFCLPGPHDYWSQMLYHRIMYGLNSST